jgi:hypothetical protein
MAVFPLQTRKKSRPATVKIVELISNRLGASIKILTESSAVKAFGSFVQNIPTKPQKELAKLNHQ